MINQILVYTLSNFSGHPMTSLENIDILSLKTSEKKISDFSCNANISRQVDFGHFFILLIESPAHKELFDVSIAKIPRVLQFQKCRRKLLTPTNIYGFRHNTSIVRI